MTDFSLFKICDKLEKGLSRSFKYKFYVHRAKPVMEHFWVSKPIGNHYMMLDYRSLQVVGKD